MPWIYYQYTYDISEAKPRQWDFSLFEKVPGTDATYGVWGLVYDQNETIADWYNPGWEFDPNTGYDYYKRGIGAITNVAPEGGSGEAPGFESYNETRNAWGRSFLNDEEYNALIQSIPPELDQLRGEFTAGNSGSLFQNLLGGYKSDVSFSYSAPTVLNGVLSPNVTAGASVSVSVPGLKALSDPGQFMSDAATSLGEYAAGALGLGALWGSVKNVATVYSALSDVQGNALNVLEHGINNFETLDPAAYDAMVDQLLRDSQGRFVEALRDVSGLPESPLFNFIGGVNMSLGPVEVQGSVELDFSVGVGLPPFQGAGPLPLPDLLNIEDPDQVTLMSYAVRDVTGSTGRDVVINPSNSPHPENDQFPLSVRLDGGNDLYIGGAEDEDIQGEDGDDILRGGLGNDLLSGDSFQPGGGQGNDALFGEEGDDALFADGGNDSFDGGTGEDFLGYIDDRFDMGLDADLATGRITGQFLGQAYTHTVTSIEVLGGTAHNDTLRGTDAGEELEGRLGDDLLEGRGGDDDLEGGPGNDTIDGGDGFDRAEYDSRFFFDSGITGSLMTGRVTGLTSGTAFAHTLMFIEALEGSESDDTLEGSDGDNVLEGDDGHDSVDGQGGNDQLLGEAGNDTLRGGAGADTVTGGDGDDLVDGGADADTLYGDAGADTLIGGAGNDLLGGGADNDSLYGDAGDDGLFTALGDDSALGGAGDDTLGGAGGNDTLDGQDGADQIWGGQGSDSLLGGSGADTLGGFTGDDFLAGGAGNDALWGALGDDVLFGDLGNDLMGGAAGRDVIDGGAGWDEIWGGGDGDTLSGGIGNDQLGGGSGDDSLSGGEGDDLLFGGIGDDTLLGDAGNDQLFGAAGNDLLRGGAGNDTIYAGAGQDTLGFGLGDGADVFRFVTLAEDRLHLDDELWSGAGTLSAAQVVSRFAAQSGTDVLLDFGAGDRILIEDASLNMLVAAIETV